MCVAHGPQSKKRTRAVEAKLGVWMSEMKRSKDRERGLQLHRDGENTTRTCHWRNERDGK